MITLLHCGNCLLNRSESDFRHHRILLCARESLIVSVKRRKVFLASGSPWTCCALIQVCTDITSRFEVARQTKIVAWERKHYFNNVKTVFIAVFHDNSSAKRVRVENVSVFLFLSSMWGKGVLEKKQKLCKWLWGVESCLSMIQALPTVHFWMWGEKGNNIS